MHSLKGSPGLFVPTGEALDERPFGFRRLYGQLALPTNDGMTKDVRITLPTEHVRAW